MPCSFPDRSRLITASASTVNLINGASPCNVYFQVGSSATLGTGTPSATGTAGTGGGTGGGAGTGGTGTGGIGSGTGGGGTLGTSGSGSEAATVPGTGTTPATTQLPYTGFDALAIAEAGVGLLLAGGLLVIWRSRLHTGLATLLGGERPGGGAGR